MDGSGWKTWLPRGNLGRRAVSAAILAPVALAAAFLGGLPLVAFCMVACVAAAAEWVRLCDAVTFRRVLPAVASTVATMVLLSWGISPAAGLTTCLLAGLASAAAFALLGCRRPFLAGIGVGYAALLGTSLMTLSAPGVPVGLVPWAFAVVWASDIGGYVAGKALGGPRLAPAISPGKTWSGLAGAILFAAAAGACGQALGTGIVSPWMAAALGGACGLVGQVGDLMESKLKRVAGQKDSGTMIPGHGGVLDRVDALMSVAPCLALFLVLTG